MKQNKIKKVIVSIIIAIISILALTQKIYAAPESIKVKLSELRYLKTTNNAYETTGFGYLINNTNVKNIYQLLKVNDNDEPIGTNFYCVNAKVGNSWTGVGADITKPVEYNQNYDLKDRETIRTALSNNEIYNLADYE